MKRIIITTLLLLTMQQYATAQMNTTPYDTIRSRHNRYYYTEWYDTCTFYLNDTSTTMCLGLDNPISSDTCPMICISKHSTSHPIAVKGLAAMVTTPEDMQAHNHSITNYNLPEYLMLLQPVDTGLLVRDTPLRWDTVAPRLMIIPLNHFDSSQVGVCHVYETFFKAPVYIDSVFYVGGTGYSNNLVYREDWGYNVQYYREILYRPVIKDPNIYDKFCRHTWETCYNPNCHYRIPGDPYSNTPEEWFDMGAYSGWGPFFPIADFYNIDAHSADSSMGSASGSGRFSDLTFVELSAHPSPGFRFSHWNDGNTDNPRSVYLTSDTAFTAFFRPEERYVVDAFSSDTSRGTVVGSGVYPEGSSVTLAAAPRHGFLFQRWNDLCTDNPRSFIVTQDTEFTALFVLPGSVSSPDSEPLFSLNPNPARESVTVTLSPSLSDLHGCRLTLHDAAGHELLAIPLDSRQLTIPTDTLPAGLYLFTLHSPQGSHTARLVIE